MSVEIKNRWSGEVIFVHSGATLQDANLRDANLRDANLQRADLQDANLRGADLQRADLRGADLRGADLQDANLRDANLRGATLQDADLRDANLRDADLRDANLRGANLRDATLQDADLRDANLRDANLRGANLRGVGDELAISLTVIVPEGAIIGWKKLCDGVIAKIRIPESARRSNAAGRKCRAEFAEVLELSEGTEGHSQYNSSFVYRVGETVRCDSWCEDRWTECGGGIHFFLTRAEAEAY